MKVYSYDNCLHLCTGAHKVLVDIHNAVKDTYDSKIVGNIDYDCVNKSLGIPENEYFRLNSVFTLRNSVLIVHQRRLAMFFSVLNSLLFLHLKIVYVHHSVLSGFRKITFFPENIVTISDKCIDNLVNYFKVPRKNITKIYNTVKDKTPELHRAINKDHIKILYPAKIYHVKRQIEIYKALKGNIPEGVEIVFAGDGEDYDELLALTKGDNNFTCLGFVTNITELLEDVDFVMLFSEYEGLSISLIEATMMGVPIICNRVGGNTEIARHGYNAFVYDSFNELIDCFTRLKNISDKEYKDMCMKSRQQYLDFFSFEMFKNNYIQFLSKI